MFFGTSSRFLIANSSACKSGVIQTAREGIFREHHNFAVRCMLSAFLACYGKEGRKGYEVAGRRRASLVSPPGGQSLSATTTVSDARALLPARGTSTSRRFRPLCLRGHRAKLANQSHGICIERASADATNRIMNNCQSQCVC